MGKGRKLGQDRRLQIADGVIESLAQQRPTKEFNLGSLYDPAMALSQALNIESVQVTAESQFGLTNDA